MLVHEQINISYKQYKYTNISENNEQNSQN